MFGARFAGLGGTIVRSRRSIPGGAIARGCRSAVGGALSRAPGVALRPTIPRGVGAALVGALALGACTVSPPTGPSILALPPEGKSLAQFQQEDLSCRDYAQAQLGPVSPQQGAVQSGVASAAVGTALGAAAGALIGSVSGNVGAGAAIGAGAGLLGGSAVGVGAASNSSYALQARYDGAYAQCIASTGNRVQQPPAVIAYGAPYAPYPYYGPSLSPSVSFGFYGGGYRYRPYGYRRYW